jgi:hypothetical protein
MRKPRQRTTSAADIREWFERHRHDQCNCQSGPPFVWAEYMDILLTMAGAPPPAPPAEPRYRWDTYEQAFVPAPPAETP